MANTLQITFDLRVYSLDALQRAALKFSDACSFDFRIDIDAVAVEITPLNSSYSLNADEFCGRFKNEVLDQHLRSVVAKETENERNLILAYAFSNTKLIAP